jgi:hypothetical protein
VIILKAMLRAERAARLAAEAEAQARTLTIENLKLTIKELRHEQFGQSSERGALLDQLELQLADLEENAAQAETAAHLVAAEKITVPSFERRKPARRPLPVPSHPIARGRAGPKLLAHILVAKYGLHLPLNRQSDVYEREGIDLDVSTLADGWAQPRRP